MNLLGTNLFDWKLLAEFNIGRISVTKYWDAQINRVILFQVFALQSNAEIMMSIINDVNIYLGIIRKALQKKTMAL